MARRFIQPHLKIFFSVCGLFLIVYGMIAWSTSFSSQPVVAPKVQEEVRPPEIQSDYQEVLAKLVGDYRAENELWQTEPHPDLCSLAERRSVVIQYDWSHDGFWTELETGVLNHFSYVGENLASEFMYPASALKGWIESPTHKEILDGQWTHDCVRCTSNYCVYIAGRLP